MNGSKLDWFAAKGALTPQDVTPWQTFSGKGMRFELEAYDWNGTAHVSHLSMRGMFGLMKMDTLICTPYTKDMPLFSYDFISAFGRKTLLLEAYDTLVGSVDLSTMTAVKEQYSDLKDKTMRPAWYDRLKLPPTVCKTGNGARLEVMAEQMLKAYIDLFATARDIDRAVKNERNSVYVEGLINDGPTYRAVSRMIGAEDAKTLFRQCLFGTCCIAETKQQ